MRTTPPVGILLLALAAGCGSSKAPAIGAVGGMGGGAPAQTPEAIRLGFVPVAMSGDGAVVVGRHFDDPGQPMRWTAATGTAHLPVTSFIVRGLSADGSTVIGEITLESGWSQPAVVVGDTPAAIAFPRASDNDGRVVGVSRDGSVIAGYTWDETTSAVSAEAFRWTAAEGAVGLGFLADDTASDVWAMSPDGETIVGVSYGAQRKVHPFRWTKATGMIELSVPTGSSLTLPIAVNDAGTVIGDSYVGGQVSAITVTNPTSRTPVVWTQGAPSPIGGCAASMAAGSAIATDGTALVSCPPTRLVVAAPGVAARLLTLPAPPPGYSVADQSIFPQGMSADGTVVVGRYDLGSLGGTANLLAVWTGTDTKPALVAQRLVNTREAVEMTNPLALAVSADGSSIAGVADGQSAWLVRLR